MKKNAFLIFLRNIILMAIGFLISVIIARSLGPDEQGKYALFILIPTIIYNLGNMGAGSSVIYLMNHDIDKKFSYLKISLNITYILALINMVVGIIFTYLYFYISQIEYDTKTFIMVIGLIPLLFLNNMYLSIYQSLKMFDKFSLYSIIPKILQLIILTIIIFFADNTIEYTILSLFISNFVILLFSYNEINSILKKNTSSDYKVSTKEFLSYGLKTHLANTITFINYRVDQFLLGIFTSSYSVGIYNIAIIILEKVWSLTNPIITVLFPEMSSMKDSNKRIEMTTKLTRIIMIFNIFVGLTMIIFMKPFIYFTFGKSYEDTVYITNIMIIGILLMSIDKILSNDFSSTGRPDINMKITNITFLVNLILGLIFIPIFGIFGAAISTTISYVVTFLLKVKVYSTKNKVRISDILLVKKHDILFLKSILKKVSK